jgi:Fe-S-cluster-containing dehydrogenase component
MKLVEAGGLAMLQDLDDCLGCFGCEAACREVNRYPYEEDWLRVVRQEPIVVDGKLRQYHLIAPLMDKCAKCYADNPEPLCITGCPAGALKLGPLADIAKEATKHHCAIFTA